MACQMRDTIARKTNSSQYSCYSETPCELCHMVYVSALSQTRMCSAVFFVVVVVLSFFLIQSSLLEPFHLGFPTYTFLVDFFSLTL